ncbi:MAG TPA: HEAT repeat domain-containing protein [Thermoanaerobaculia bacterium]|nr:HEAT repeat domain-containing protein [Thermoanaerobaculia bacterium]
MTERMPFLLTESLDAARREETHQHIETCTLCSEEWSAYQETWRVMDDLPVVEVPPALRERFLAAAGLEGGRPVRPENNVVPFHRRPAFKWVAQAAAVVVLAGSGYFFGRETAPTFRSEPVSVERAGLIKPLSIAETRVVDANAISPEIEGRPNITNVSFIDGDASDNQIRVAFDITSRWTVTGNPRDKSMVRLLSYMLESEAGIAPRSNALDVVRRTYSDPANADPEIAHALAKVLRNDEHEGVRIRAVETLTTLPANVALPTRDALIEALKNDPNPAVRLKAVQALANMAQSGATLDAEAVNTLRLKAAQDDENLYVRVKAAEALSKIKH